MSEIVTLAERPDLLQAALELLAAGWPEFMQHDAAQDRYLPRLIDDFAAFQVLLVDPDGGRLRALGASIPFAWDGTTPGLPAGWDAVVQQGVADLDAGRAPTAAAGLSITVAPDQLGQGLSGQVIQALKRAAAAAGLGAMVVPVRPTRKSAYPLTPMDRYVRWTRQDGTLFDPWLRTHVRAGARVVGVCPESMLITGTVAEWEGWTEMSFPETGPYVVPGALVPVAIDRERDEGRYVEPNVWVRHPVELLKPHA